MYRGDEVLLYVQRGERRFSCMYREEVLLYT